MRFASLGSGSDGNALLISAGSGKSSTHVMLDCGFVMREVEKRITRFQLNPSELAGIIVTHEHSDHIGGVFKLARRYKLPVWLSHGTLEAARSDSEGVDVRICRDGEALVIGDLEIRPFTVPHDAREPLQYVASDGVRKLGVLTDIGQPTPHVTAALSGCDALLLEFNHDSEMLANSAYPPFLKSRIAGPLGHLSNEHSAQLLAALDRSKLKRLVAAHLSKKNNTPELVRTEIDKVVDQDVEVVIAGQDEGFDWMEC
ncbi:MAG: MBL fold metallo-hydrolase [Oxalobacteraceae bacterium]|jgi:phosphoribosyl 1,2-cyclic phosphodiesterase|nr:MBL fold metallo-hydrolase [Oxalobacteraceae bacterium]